MTHSELARVLLRANHSMTRLVDVLERDGLVRRHRDKKDRRTVYVKVTPAGLDFMKEYIDQIDLIEKEVMSCFDENERKTLRHLIRKLSEQLTGEPLTQSLT